MLTAVSVHITNASNNTPVVGAKIFIDGTIVTKQNQAILQTDSNGNASLLVTPNAGVRVLQVTATNFQQVGQSFNTVPFPPASIQIAMTPVVLASSIINFQFIPSVAGITWQLIQNTVLVDNGVSTGNGLAISAVPIPVGTYTIQATLDGCQPLNQSFNITGQTSPYTFTLIKLNNPNNIQQGNTNGDSSALTTTPASILSRASFNQPVSNEYRYPSTDYDKYFTITGVCIYIGHLFIDEVNTIQYAVQDNAIPIYGYSSRYVDAFGQGRSLVQGQLTLNFVTEGYLYTVLQEYKRLLSLSTQTVGDLLGQDVTQVLDMMTSRDTYLQQAKHLDSSDFSVSNPATLARQLSAQITAKMSAMTPAQTTSLSTQLQQRRNVVHDVVSFDNAVYQDVLFDIRIEMGNEATGIKRIRYIEKCKLISNEQVIAPDGQAILDSYGFIGRRLR